MNKMMCLALALALAALTTGCGSPPKILVGHHFAGQDKSVKVMLQDAGQNNKANNTKLFNVFVRMCDVQNNAEAQCKDTQLLDNVVPGSVY